ncbi:MAG: hypothetical protein PHE78_07545 [Candidatus Gastranaerophilales bacterium]|nr:hypothetical protein [Candidatus Gastranaerophilales bacterium]
MSSKTITINGIKISLIKEKTVFDIIEKFFRSRCEFLVELNSQPVQINKIKEIYLSNSDELKIVAYSKNYYSVPKRTIVSKDKEKQK